MRLMYTTALASAVLFAGPALAAGDKVEGTTGMTAPESSAAQLGGGQSADVQKDFESAGFSGWQEASDVQILRMQWGAGEPVWVVLMPDSFQVGAAEPQAMDSPTGDLAAASGSDVSGQEQGGGMPQRGEQADISETFEGEGGQQQDLAGAPELPGQQDEPQGESQLLPDGQPATEVPQGGRELGTADQGQVSGQQDIAEAPGAGQAGEHAGAAGAQEGIVGETEPEGFAAQIPGELRSGLEGAGFQQIESVDGADFFHAKTQDGQTAFIIVGELGGAGFGSGGQQPIDLDRSAPGGAPGATPDLPEPAPGTPAPQQAPGQQ